MRSVLPIAFGFATFGLLIGFICGVSTAEITTPLVAALFSLIAGKIFIDFDKLSNDSRLNIGVILVSFSIFCLTGICSGIFVKVHQSFGYTTVVTEKGELKNADYLKGSTEFRDDIFERYRKSKSSNCDSLLNILEKQYHSIR